MNKVKWPVSMALFLYFLFACVSLSFAHFGVILPSRYVVDAPNQGRLNLQLQFMHPFDYEFMDLERPKVFGVVVNGNKKDLTSTLRPETIKAHKAWRATYQVLAPGDHIFFMVPKPYWEPAEDTYIQHLTKVVVGAFGLEDGWSRPIGLKAEIVPLTRPYGLWKGNLFCGKVLLDGRPSPGTRVEVEYYNKNGTLHAPSPVFTTQTLYTGRDGSFCYAIPRAGWWGFAALNSLPGALKRKGRQVDLEIGAVIWVHAVEVH